MEMKQFTNTIYSQALHPIHLSQMLMDRILDLRIADLKDFWQHWMPQLCDETSP